MHFNPHTILPIICLILTLAFGIFVLAQNLHARLNRIFFVVCLTIVAWLSFYIPFNFPISDKNLILWFRISYCFISFLPIMVFTFITTYLNAPKNIFWYRINTTIGLSFCLMSLFTDWIVKGINYLPWYTYPKAGVAHIFLVFHCIYLGYLGIKLMLEAIKKPGLTAKQLNHIRYLIVAVLTAYTAMVDFLGNYNIPSYPIGYISSTIFLLTISVAILKHQLMDIRIIIRKSIIYSTLITLITIIFLVLVLIVEKLSQSLIGYKNLFSSIILSVFVALIFIPLKNKIQTYVDKIFFKGTHLEVALENVRLKEELTHTEKMKAIAMIASSLAHEIKNPLTAIQTFTEYLPEKKNDNEFIDQYTRIVGQEAQRINTLIQELLIFAKPSEPKFEPVNPNDLIQNLIKLLSSQIAKVKIQLQTNFTTPSPIIQADPAQLKQALLNILVNAIESMPIGGILTIKTTTVLVNPSKIVIASPRLKHSGVNYAKQSQNKLSFPNASIGNPQYIITISDTGCGIAPKDLSHIFEPFFSKKEKGTGLGLAITQGIIEKHGGKLSVESQLNQGTTFSIFLPLNYAF